MKNPFPGMDPYLEQYWVEVHHRLITYSRDQLQSQLPSGLRARIEQRVFVETPDDEARKIRPDDEPIHQGYIEIVDTATGRDLITVIEFLSPSNKFSGEGQELYLQKQQEVLRSKANLVEIDLTRAGKRRLAYPVSRMSARARATYQACIHRGNRPLKYEIYPFPLNARLPILPIPLRPGDDDVKLNLQAIVDRCYEHGGYNAIDYRAEPKPPFSAKEAAWADAFLKEQKRR